MIFNIRTTGVLAVFSEDMEYSVDALEGQVLFAVDASGVNSKHGEDDIS